MHVQLFVHSPNEGPDGVDGDSEFIGNLFVAMAFCQEAEDLALARAEVGWRACWGNAGFQRALGGLLLAGICLLVVKRRVFKVQAHAPHELVIAASVKKWRGVWPWVLGNALAGQTLGVSCMQWALETTPAGIVFAILALTPVVIIPFARALEGERPSTRSLVGCAIAVAGVVALALAR